VRKLLIGLVLLGACKSTTTVIPASAPLPASSAASTPRVALDAFMSAIRAGDLQAMSVAWGDKTGPIRDSKLLSREEVEQRELILVKCLKHDSYRVLGDAPGADNERVLQVEMTRGTQTHVADFYTAHGPDRWFVRTANMRDLCSAK
jgi:hypothetical protein